MRVWKTTIVDSVPSEHLCYVGEETSQQLIIPSLKIGLSKTVTYMWDVGRQNGMQKRNICSIKEKNKSVQRPRN